MTHIQNVILRELYKQHQNGKPLCTLQFKQIDPDKPSDLINAINGLIDDGYISESSRSIGCTISGLTDYGLSFCKQSYDAQ